MWFRVLLARFSAKFREMRFLILLMVVLIGTTSSSGMKTKQQLRGCYDNLCSKGQEKYPTNKIKKLLNRYKQSDLTMEDTVIEPTLTQQTQMRAVPLLGEENLCQSTRVTIFPTFDREDNLTIVNIKGNYQQKLVFEKCVTGSGRCRKAGILDYETSCKQLYNNVRLLYVDSKNKLKYKLFHVPNACVCVYKRTMYRKEQ